MGIIRKTQSVEIVLQEFNINASAISVIELVKRLNSKMNKTTVYRILDKLESDGVLHSFLNNNGIKWYAKCAGCSKSHHSDTHPHFQCTECGKIDCLAVDVVIPTIPNRKITASQILLQGKCEACY